MRRDEVFGIIHNRFASHISSDLNTEKDLTIISTSDTANNLDKHKLDMSSYVLALSQSDFFICPPGWLMPHSHNMVEAMSVGAIPITNYAHYVSPPLIDGVNCIAFSNEETLVSAIERARSMTGDEISAMQAAVLTYYEKNLDPIAVGTALRQYLCQVQRIIVNDESGR
jgi:hypothetical protein